LFPVRVSVLAGGGKMSEHWEIRNLDGDFFLSVPDHIIKAAEKHSDITFWNRQAVDFEISNPSESRARQTATA
jgi:hypothetical protein